MGKSTLGKIAGVASLGLSDGMFNKPKAPNYEDAAERTAAENQKLLEAQTRANRPNQTTPWGSVTWEQDDAGNWSQNTSLNPGSQESFDAQQRMQLGRSQLSEGMMGRMQNEFGGPMQWGDFGEQQGLDFDPTEMRQKAEDAAYGRATSRLDPRFEQQGSGLEIKMRNQGLSPGDAAWDAQMGNFNRGKEDAYSNARNQSVQQGRAESGQLWDQQKGSADYANQLRQNSMKEEMQKRGFSLNEMNAIMSGQQVGMPEMTPFNQAGRVAGPDYSGAANSQSNFNQGQYQSDMAMFGDMAGAAGSMFAFCDRRLKRNIKRIGKYLGYPLYVFEYVWGEIAIGVMSDEVNQDAVATHMSGYDIVNYAKIIPTKG